MIKSLKFRCKGCEDHRLIEVEKARVYTKLTIAYDSEAKLPDFIYKENDEQVHYEGDCYYECDRCGVYVRDDNGSLVTEDNIVDYLLMKQEEWKDE